MTAHDALATAFAVVIAVPASGRPINAGPSATPAPAQFSPPSDGAGGVEAAIADWPEKARHLAAEVAREYGRPDEIRSDQLTWRRRRPWTMIAVFRDARSDERPDNLLQSLAYEVSPRNWRSLSSFERGVTYDPVRKELVARGESEEANLLALNLADDIIQEKRTPADATEFYDRTLSLARSGRSSAYMFRLLFSPALRDLTRRQRGLNEDMEREVQRLSDRNR